MTHSSDRAGPKLPGWLIVGALAIVGYLLMRIAFMVSWEGIPRRVTAQQVTTITGIELPADSQVVHSRYRAGLRERSLYAEFTLPREELPRFVKKTGESLGTVFSDSQVWAHWETFGTNAPSWWARRQDVATDAYAFQASPGRASRSVYLAVGRNTEGEARVYLAWIASQ